MGDDKDQGGEVTLKGPVDLNLVRDLGQIYTSSDAAKETGSTQEQTTEAWGDASADAND